MSRTLLPPCPGKSSSDFCVIGSLCGAVFVDDRFLDLLKNKFKGIFEGAWDSLDPEELKDIMSQNWENGIRNQFSGETRTWTVRVPHSILDGVPRDQRGKYPKLIEISSKELEDVIHPIVEKIKSLVDAQVDAVKSKEGCPPKVCYEGTFHLRMILVY